MSPASKAARSPPRCGSTASTACSSPPNCRKAGTASFELERGSSAVDDFIAPAGSRLLRRQRGRRRHAVPVRHRRPTARTSTYQFDGVVFKLAQAGTWRGDQQRQAAAGVLRQHAASGLMPTAVRRACSPRRRRRARSRDAQGRRLALRRLGALDKLRLFKAAGAELSPEPAWLGMAVLACSRARRSTTCRCRAPATEGAGRGAGGAPRRRRASPPSATRWRRMRLHSIRTSQKTEPAPRSGGLPVPVPERGAVRRRLQPRRRGSPRLGGRPRHAGRRQLRLRDTAVGGMMRFDCDSRPASRPPSPRRPNAPPKPPASMPARCTTASRSGCRTARR